MPRRSHRARSALRRHRSVLRVGWPRDRSVTYGCMYREMLTNVLFVAEPTIHRGGVTVRNVDRGSDDSCAVLVSPSVYC